MSTQDHGKFRELFTQQVQRPEEDLELDRAALYVAGEEYPELDVDFHLERLDVLAENVRERAAAGASTQDLSSGLADYLFTEMGFSGNSGDYYSPDNSFLNRVLATRTGIPILLCLVYLEVGRRLGLSCRGVGLPGHFLIGLEEPGWYLDPFNGGQLLSADDCRALVDRMFGPRLPWNDDFLTPYNKHDFLFRMLNNLKDIYQRNQELAEAKGVIQRMLIIRPGLPPLYKDLAWCHYHLTEFRLAIENLKSYLQVAPEAEDAGQVEEQIQSIWAALSRLN